MKTIIKITTGLALATLLAGCVVTSVHPFYTAKDVVFDPALSGVWEEAGSTNSAKEQWRFEPVEGQAYQLTVQEKEKRTEFDAHLFKLEGRIFLDLYPRERPDYALPLHYLLKVNRIEPALEMSMIEHEWLKKLIEKDAGAISHLVAPKRFGEDGEGELVLTAETTELQAFIRKHQKTKEAFGDLTVMNRVKR